jgi:hypothetical protein
VLRVAIRPIGRAIRWGTALGIVGLAWAPLAITMLRGGTDLVGAYVFAVVVGSGVLALAVDDEVIELTSSAPVPLVQRNGLRLAELVTVALAAAAVAVVVGVGRDPALRATLDERAAEAAAVAALALALASVLAGQRVPGAGLVGAISSSGAVALVAVLALRFDWLPGLLGEQHHDWWWLIAIAAAAVAAWAWRDPATRAPRGCDRRSR